MVLTPPCTHRDLRNCCAAADDLVGRARRLQQRLMVVSMGNIGVLSVCRRISRGYASHESMERSAMDAPNAACELPEVQWAASNVLHRRAVHDGGWRWLFRTGSIRRQSSVALGTSVLGRGWRMAWCPAVCLGFSESI